MQFDLPISPIPNQFFSTSLNGVTWGITLETRLGKIYISLKRNGEDVLLNRVCLDRTPVDYGFVFVDIDGNSAPSYEQLGTRYILIYDDTLDNS